MCSSYCTEVGYCGDGKVTDDSLFLSNSTVVGGSLLKTVVEYKHFDDGDLDLFGGMAF